MARQNGRLYGNAVEMETNRSVFRNLFFSMIAFGILVGMVFPPFAKIVLNSDRALSAVFISMCIAAGFLVGLVNYVLFNMVVSRDLARVVGAMQKVLNRVEEAESQRLECAEDCQLQVTSNDAIGEIEHAFNEMTSAIAWRLSLEGTSRTLNSELSASVDVQEVSAVILRTMADILESKVGLLYGDTGDGFELISHFGVDRKDSLPRRLGDEFGLVVHALQEGKVYPITPWREGLEWLEQSTPLAGFRPKSLILIPMQAKQRAVGLVVLAGDLEGISDEQLEMLETLRSQGAPYLQNAILHRKITDLAAIDDLTMILNRRFGLRRLREEFSRSVRHGVPVSVLMIDIDHFKAFNDDFGHDAGDTVLRMVASIIERNLRAGDVVCRYGGEEFMVVAPGTGLNDAAMVGERLRRLVETTQIKWGAQRLSVTASIGAATWPMTRVSVSEELISAADKALYSAKETGRNRVAAHRGDDVIPFAALVADTNKMPVE